MSKQTFSSSDRGIFPCPVNLHSNNGFDLARRMNRSAVKRIKKSAKMSSGKNRSRRYLAKTVPGKSGKIIFTVKRRSFDFKTAAETAIILPGKFFLTAIRFMFGITWKTVSTAAAAVLIFTAVCNSLDHQMIHR